MGLQWPVALSTARVEPRVGIALGTANRAFEANILIGTHHHSMFARIIEAITSCKDGG
jgi:hypothetical protein